MFTRFSAGGRRSTKFRQRSKNDGLCDGLELRLIDPAVTVSFLGLFHALRVFLSPDLAPAGPSSRRRRWREIFIKFGHSPRERDIRRPGLRAMAMCSGRAKRKFPKELR